MFSEADVTVTNPSNVLGGLWGNYAFRIGDNSPNALGAYCDAGTANRFSKALDALAVAQRQIRRKPRAE